MCHDSHWTRRLRSSSASGEKKLDFITGMATGSVHLKTLQSITDAFEKENPGVKINLIPSSQDFTQDIKVRLAARNAPDLWNTHGWSPRSLRRLP